MKAGIPKINLFWRKKRSSLTPFYIKFIKGGHKLEEKSREWDRCWLCRYSVEITGPHCELFNINSVNNTGLLICDICLGSEWYKICHLVVDKFRTHMCDIIRCGPHDGEDLADYQIDDALIQLRDARMPLEVLKYGVCLDRKSIVIARKYKTLRRMRG
jgi:hypothetical protein